MPLPQKVVPGHSDSRTAPAPRPEQWEVKVGAVHSGVRLKLSTST